MRVSIICSDPRHPVDEYLRGWIDWHGRQHEIELVRSKIELIGGEILLLIPARFRALSQEA